MIQPLCQETLSQAIALIDSTFPDQPLLENGELALRVSLLPEWVKKSLTLERLQYWTIIEDGVLIGITGLYAWANQPGYGWVAWTVVRPEFRTRGHGLRLIEYVKTVAASSGIVRLCVYTEPWRVSAISLYEKTGFVVQSKSDSRVVYGVDFSA